MMIASTGFTPLASEGGAAAEDAPPDEVEVDPPQNCHQGLPAGGVVGVEEVSGGGGASPSRGDAPGSCVSGLGGRGRRKHTSVKQMQLEEKGRT